MRNIWDGVFIWNPIGQPHATASPWMALAEMAVNDGVVVINGRGECRPILPKESSEVRTHMERYRSNNDPFDIAAVLWFEGNDSAKEGQEITHDQDGGATWRLETLSIEQFSSVNAARERLHKGPPGASKEQHGDTQV